MRPPIAIGSWYVPPEGHPRWVLAVRNARVLYSRGGDRHYECLVRTFRRWQTKAKAEVTTP